MEAVHISDLVTSAPTRGNSHSRSNNAQGWTAIAGCRQFFYARYADYAITMPLIVLQLGIVSGADQSQIAATIGAEGEFLSQHVHE
jgi:bacteriorhodopsin